MDDFELTLIKEEDSERSFFKKLFIIEGKTPHVTDLALLRGAYKKGSFWTSSAHDFDSYEILYNYSVGALSRGKMFDVACYMRNPGIRPFLIPSSNLYESLLNQKIEILPGLYQVPFLEYPQKVASNSEQFILKEKLDSNELPTTGKMYTFDNTRLEYGNEDVSFEGKEYKEYVEKGQKYIYVDNHIDLEINGSIVLSNGCESRFGDKLFVKVEPVLWWIDEEKKALFATETLLGGIQFQRFNIPYNDDFYNTFMKYYLNNYMKKELVPSMVPSKSEVFDSSPTLQRFVYQKRGLTKK